MPDPWVPPYFISWQHLVDEELGNPRLGWPTPHPWLVAMSRPATGMPHSAPNRQTSLVNGLVGALVSAVSVRELAATMPRGHARAQLEGSADAAIDQILDDYCGTHPRVPWPWPGPLPWALETASELLVLANAMTVGGMREGLLRVAGLVLSQSLGVFGAGKKDPSPSTPPQPPGGGAGEGPKPDPEGPSSPF
jgi:hypothetical protein